MEDEAWLTEERVEAPPSGSMPPATSSIHGTPPPHAILPSPPKGQWTRGDMEEFILQYRLAKILSLGDGADTQTPTRRPGTGQLGDNLEVVDLTQDPPPCLPVPPLSRRVFQRL